MLLMASIYKVYHMVHYVYMSRNNIIITVLVIIVLGAAYYWYARAEMIRKIPPNAGFPLPGATTTNVGN